MLFILCVLLAIVGFFVWRSASGKGEQRNIAYKGLAGISGVGAGKVGLPIIMDTK